MGYPYRTEHFPPSDRTVDWIARRARTSRPVARVVAELAGFNGPEPDAWEPLKAVVGRVIDKAAAALGEPRP